MKTDFDVEEIVEGLNIYAIDNDGDVEIEFVVDNYGSLLGKYNEVSYGKFLNEEDAVRLICILEEQFDL